MDRNSRKKKKKTTLLRTKIRRFATGDAVVFLSVLMYRTRPAVNNFFSSSRALASRETR